MSLLASAKTGIEKHSQIIVVYGPNGVGKSTFASQFPKPLFADLEKGSRHLKVTRLDEFKDLSVFKALVKELIETNSNYETFVVDSIESLEFLVLESIKLKYKAESIEDIPYGKGYAESREVMAGLMDQFRKLTNKGIGVVLVGHSQTKQQTDATTKSVYDRAIMRCGDKMAAVIKDLSDAVLFATHKVVTTTNKQGKTEAFSDGTRVLFTQWRDNFDAKNRMGLPLEIPLSYEALNQAMSTGETLDAAEILADIAEISSKLKDDVRVKVQAQVEKFKTDPKKLAEIRSRAQKFAVNQ